MRHSAIYTISYVYLQSDRTNTEYFQQQQQKIKKKIKRWSKSKVKNICFIRFILFLNTSVQDESTDCSQASTYLFSYLGWRERYQQHPAPIVYYLCFDSDSVGYLLLVFYFIVLVCCMSYVLCTLYYVCVLCTCNVRVYEKDKWSNPFHFSYIFSVFSGFSHR